MPPAKFVVHYDDYVGVHAATERPNGALWSPRCEDTRVNQERHGRIDNLTAERALRG
jgi:hypothetical protein